MKKNLVLLLACLSASIGVHAITQPQAPTVTQSAPAKATELQVPANNDAAIGDVGSGDDVDTFNGSEPAYDSDPEVDDTSIAKPH